MRILVVIPHYFGPAHPENNLASIGSYIEPLGRIAALNEAIVSLHGHFGPNRHYYDGTAIAADANGPERQVDIVVLAIRGRELTAELGLAPGTIEVEYVDCKPPWIAFESQRVFRERLGQYDFYCFMEDDLIIHDPAFFDKLAWFQATFGPKTLLMPVRYEVPATGTPAKIITDVDLAEEWYRPFRRPGQRETIEGVWNGCAQTFHLPKNPHAGAFFLTGEQMDYWVERPSYGDRHTPWTGPIESAGTLSVGRVFDLYKPVQPDPFFLEIQHFGVRYSSQFPPSGRRYGEPPLLAIAQNALRAALGDAPPSAPDGVRDPALASLIGRWLAQGTAVELRGQLDTLERDATRHRDDEARNAAERDTLTLQMGELHQYAAALEEQRDASRRHATGLEQYRDQLLAHTANLEQHRDALLQQAADLEQHAAGLEQQRDQLLGQTATLEQRREELVQQAANLEQQRRDLSQERDRLSQQIAALEARMGETLAQVAARDAEIARLTDQADQSALEREGLMIQVAKLGQQVEYEQHAQRVHQRSLRWLLGSIRAELRRRWQSRKGG